MPSNTATMASVEVGGATFVGNNKKRYAHLVSRNLRNFEVRQEDMMTFMLWRGMLSGLSYKVFSGPLDGDVDIQFHASCINVIVF